MVRSAVYERFERLAKALIEVPKTEIDKRQAEYEKKKAAKKRKVARGADRSPLKRIVLLLHVLSKNGCLSKTSTVDGNRSV
jgi:hypothetical protein